MKVYIKFWQVNLKENGSLEDLVIDGRIESNSISQE
jgi:hypothetical protein